MKKILPSIFIFTILAGMFAPFTLKTEKDRLELTKNVASAATLTQSFGPYTDKATCDTSHTAVVANKGSSDTVTDCTQDSGATTYSFTITKTSTPPAAATGSTADVMPPCAVIFGEGTILGCLVQAFYYVFFVPTSALFGLAGKFFDWTFAYSISDDSYRTAFVTEGWGIMRDVCNIFFIFILIYSAFKLILNVGHGEKGTIIAVIIIGLLINFSLFTTKVLIDTSNILARVFYNSENTDGTSIVGVSGNSSRGGVDVDQSTGLGEKPLSAALVDKVDPQRIIADSKGMTLGDDVAGASGSATSKNSPIGVGAFFLITFLAVIVNIVGMFVFLSVGLIFVARVIGLWFAMIFVPFAFLSYTIPSMQGIKNIGWKSWWSETVGMCFLAPIFMFFLFLILKFIKKGFLGITESTSNGNMIMGIIIPFVFIMVMLMMAKKLAKDYSGSMGQTITKGIATVGAMALGGAALTTAWAGRGVGNMIKKSSESSSAEKYRQIAEQRAQGKNVSGSFMTETWGRLGNKLNKSQKRVESVDHARHELDDLTSKRYKGQTFNKLSGYQKGKIEEDFKRTKKGDEDAAYRREKGLKSNEKLTEADRQEIEKRLQGKFDHFIVEAKGAVDGKKVNQFERVFSKSNTGTWDARNLSDSKSDKRANILTKLGVGAVAAIALGVRTGVKTGFGADHGKGQGNILKDLKETITAAMKGVKIEVPSGGGGHGGDHGGGDHGGGGHH